MNEDFLDLLRALLAAEVRFLVVGAYAVGVHGRPRATKDLDVWVEPSVENAPKVIRALLDFGAPLMGLTAMDLENGKMPGTNEILTALKADGSQKPLVDMIEDGTIKLTGTKNRSAMWAYEVDSETKGRVGPGRRVGAAEDGGRNQDAPSGGMNRWLDCSHSC